MSFFTWTPEMSVGLDRLDEDHKGLIHIINGLATSLESADSIDETAIDRSFLALIRYTEIHFTREEEVLKAVGYKETPAHRKEHEAFIQDILQMREKYRDANEDVRRNLLNYLKGWLNSHILIEDMAYKESVENHPAARNAAECFAPLDVKPAI